MFVGYLAYEKPQTAADARMAEMSGAWTSAGWFRLRLTDFRGRGNVRPAGWVDVTETQGRPYSNGHRVCRVMPPNCPRIFASHGCAARGIRHTSSRDGGRNRLIRPFRTDEQSAARGPGSHTEHELTLVIPAFNEELRLPATLTGVRDELDRWGIDYRVIVANDGSRDRTAALAVEFGPRFSTLSLPQQRGKGAAVRAGILNARGRVVAFTDADLPYDLAALRHGYERIVSGSAEIAFGARDLAESKLNAPRRLSRTLATFVFRQCVRCLVSRDVTDTQCGLKVFSREAAEAVFSRTLIDGFAFDAEVVYLTHHLRIPFCRIPVTLINEYASTLSLRRHAFPMLCDVLSIHRRAWRGEYDTPRTTAEEALRPIPQRKAA